MFNEANEIMGDIMDDVYICINCSCETEPTSNGLCERCDAHENAPEVRLTDEELDDWYRQQCYGCEKNMPVDEYGVHYGAEDGSVFECLAYGEDD